MSFQVILRCRCPQADLVSIIAHCLPNDSRVDKALVYSGFLPCTEYGLECMGDLPKARARAAVLGALARGVQVTKQDRRTQGLTTYPDLLLKRMLKECCECLHPCTEPACTFRREVVSAVLRYPKVLSAVLRYPKGVHVLHAMKSAVELLWQSCWLDCGR
jgi:hypothetical protein